jgi:hypothetical protein
MLSPAAITQRSANYQRFRKDAMNSKIAMFISLILMLGSITIWSVSELSAETMSTEILATPPAEAVDTSTTGVARRANEEAANEAVRSIQSDNRLDLDIRLIATAGEKLAAR